MKKCIVIAGIGMLAACTAVSDISTRQNGSLSVTSRARTFLTSWNSVRNAGLKHATAYCNEQNKRMHAIDVHTIGIRGVGDETVEIVFECF